MLVLSTPTVSYSINVNGLQFITFTGQTPINVNSPTGIKQGLYSDGSIPPDIGTAPLGNLLSSTITKTKNGVIIDRIYQGVNASWYYSVNSLTNDLIVQLTLTSKSNLPFSNIIINLPTFNFSSQPTGNLTYWWTNYIESNQPMHPSFWVPLACSYIIANNISICLHCQSHFDKPTLFNAFNPDNVIPQVATPTLYVTDTVEPGQNLTIKYTIRVLESPVTLNTLVSSYVQDFQAFAGLMQYTPDQRPLLRFTSFDASWVTPTNPLGYNGESRRFDLATGIPLFEAMVSPSLLCSQGTIFWQPQGYNPRGCQYRPDFDVWPDTVKANLPILINWYNANNIKFGLMAAPTWFITSGTYETDTLWEYDPTDEIILNQYWLRFSNVLALGVKMFYLDSMGSDLTSYEIMKWLRAKLGPSILTISEQTSDLMLAYSGVYLDLLDPVTGNTRYYDAETLQIFRMLYPESVFVVTGINNNEVPTVTTDQLGGWKLTPMFEDFEAPIMQSYMTTFCTVYLNGQNWN